MVSGGQLTFRGEDSEIYWVTPGIAVSFIRMIQF